MSAMPQLSPPFEGAIHHVAYVVEDIDAAVGMLAGTFGAGPFFVVRDVQFEALSSRGDPATFAHDSAFGQLGTVTIEVMQVRRLEPERVRAGFAMRAPQLHHVAYAVEASRLGSVREELERRGLPAFLHAKTGEIDSTLHDATTTLGHHIEVHADSRQLRQVFGMVRNAASNWDGREPLRAVP